MSQASKPYAWAINGLTFAAVLLLTATAYAQQVGPFASLAGAWSGSGTLALSKGAKERIRCRAKYEVENSGSNLKLELRCASDSYKFELQADVVFRNGEVQGNWNETSRRVAGRLAGTIKGDQFDVRVESPSFSALLALTTSGDRQSIAITGAPGSQMTQAAITLERGS
jgi:autotransporter translocation and assembly factor TamB